MSLKKILLIAILAGMIGNGFSKTIRLNTNISAPYQYLDGDKLVGTSVKTLKCVFGKSSIDYEFRIKPWKRSWNDLKKGKADGLFTAMKKEDKISNLKMSSPLALEKWFWFRRKGDNRSPKSGKIGATIGSNQKTWLEKNGYKVSHKVSTGSKSLINLLNAGRIDTFIADLKSVEESKNYKAEKMDAIFHKYVQLVVYFSKSYLGENDSFLKEFNSYIYDCSPLSVKLNSKERKALNKLAKEKIKKIFSNPTIIKMIKVQNKKHKSLSEDKIIALDKKWRKEVKTENYDLVKTILSNDVSKILKKIKMNSKHLYSEVFIMDNKGLNVGQSDKTSDYWQGDEGKFKKSYGAGKNSVFIDEIEYDESSQTFQAQVSMTISDSGKKIGAITVGVNVEKALSSKH